MQMIKIHSMKICSITSTSLISDTNNLQINMFKILNQMK